ncbi:RHS repeat-associated core domain-containing protein [Flavobacterium sp.]|uniref:RHS repeat-associated core domain-containing protein n=2 Tax=Flavobacterium sp. TaxID=239 RepID=UPI0040479EB3
MRHYLIILFFLSFIGYSQVESVPVVGNDKNWVSSISYDLSGQTLSKGVSYFDVLGKGTQSLSWDVLTGRVWASEVRYDSFGRPVLGTLSAPINNTGSFTYKPDFIMTPSGVLNFSHYDGASTLLNPSVISNTPNSLGWYYSDVNTLDAYQDVTSYPYTRTIFSELNPGSVKAVLGGNKINNEWKQAYSFTMVGEKPVNSNSLYNFYQGKKVLKTVSRDVHGFESVVYADTDGNVLGAARSGVNLSGTPNNISVYSDILDKGYVDVHVSGNSGVLISNYESSKHTIRIFDLITEEDVTSLYVYIPGLSYSLPQGFYRIEDVKNHYGNATTPVTALRVTHSVSYYDFSYNEYDVADRLIKTVQPVASTQESTFKYNSLGQLLETTSVDEGTSKFKYRKDGQIRFSQNVEQAKKNQFSYTNYDELGRPVESGVYTGTEIYFGEVYDIVNSTYFPSVDAIVDQLDGLPIDGRSEQNFSVYDVVDSNLPSKLMVCSLPSSAYKQSYMAGNISYTYTQNPETNKTWYSYDIYGRVKWIIQEPEGISCLKTIDYEYDPINGQLVKVDYQKNSTSDRFVHYYTYNIAGQLTDVHTSINGTVLTRQAHYIYNESGALTRTELADNLQGIDYVYNLQGQLKAINHPSLQSSDDPGNDGANGFAADVFGMQLDYYNGDYTRTNTPKPIATTPQGVNQYNGNIKAARWNTQIPSTTQNAYLYQYNKNNWMTQATFGQASATAAITPDANNDYTESNLTYDANGNILSLTRTGYTDVSGSNSMDNFTYVYDQNNKNRLSYVKDTQDNPDTLRYNDIKNQENLIQTGANPITGAPIYTSLNNYVYNDLGQLTVNLQENITYDYNASGLVTRIGSLASNDSGDYITLEYRGYDRIVSRTSLADQWTLSTGATVGNLLETTYTDCTLSVDPDAIIANYGDNIFLRFLGNNNGFKTQLRVSPNTFTKVDLDVLLDTYMMPGRNRDGLVDPDGNPVATPAARIIPSAIITFKAPDGTVLGTHTIASQPVEYCERYFDEHVSFSYTSGAEQYITMEIASSYVLHPDSESTDYNQKQQTYIDNIHIQSAQQTKVAFFYDDRGQRIRKESYSGSGLSFSTQKTFYVRDAAGSIMGIYTQKIQNGTLPLAPSIAEHSMYGSGRIGVYKRGGKTGGYTLYELTDHLGNVRAVLRKTGTAAYALTSNTDYYPFGEPMPNKHTTDGNYRYAFQGQEKDPETGMEAFELRLWDGRLGRWLTVDPYHEFYSPYVGMGNNPISSVDVDGGYVYILGKNGLIKVALDSALLSDKALGEVGKFINDPNNHIIFKDVDLNEDGRQGRLGNTIGPLTVGEETILSKENIDNLLKERAKLKADKEGAIDFFKQFLMSNFSGTTLHPGNNYIISIDVEENLRIGKIVGSNVLRETVGHEPMLHGHENKTTEDQDHISGSGNRYGNYSRPFSRRVVGTKLDVFLKQLNMADFIMEKFMPINFVIPLTKFNNDTEQLKWHEVSSSPRHF